MVSNGERVLVTGATGYIGAHLVGLLLEKGYHVRAAVRSQKKADSLAARFSAHKDHLEFVFVDLSKPHSFNDVLGGITGIFHVAAPLAGSLKTSVKEDYLDPAIEGNLGLLRAAAKTPSVKRVVLTSSFVSLLGASSDPNHEYSEKDWNPITYEEAQKLAGAENDFNMYKASKKLSEKAAWDFMEKEKPHFDLVTILPSYVFGPAQSSAESSDISSLSLIVAYLTTKTEVEPSYPFQHLVDVRDVALSEVLAYENPKASGQRYLINAEPYSWQEIVEIAHKDFAGKTKAPAPANLPLPQFMNFNNSKSTQELRLVYREKKVTLHDSIASILELKQQGKL